MSHGAADESSWVGQGPDVSVGSEVLYLFPSLERAPWWRALLQLQAALARNSSAGAVRLAYAELLGRLATAGHADLRSAAAADLLGGTGPLSGYAADSLPAGLLFALEKDLTVISALTGMDHARLVAARLNGPVPPLTELAAGSPPGVLGEALTAALQVLDAEQAKLRVQLFASALARYGSGPAALYAALAWSEGRLHGHAHPDLTDWSELVGLDEQLARLAANVEALLAGAGAHHTLLYGPRGSGKSTAVRGLINRFVGRGLRLVEVFPTQLASLPDLVEQLRRQPTSFVLYVDDLAFDEGDATYRPLKSLLEGGLAGKPGNLILLATSNRRHLVKEQLSDRPKPEDDVHGWDTHNEKLALADRFGLTITFPSSGQRHYLNVVRALAALRGLQEVSGEHAIRFAEWGNGYSGRTAKQFVDELTRASERQPAT